MLSLPCCLTINPPPCFFCDFDQFFESALEFGADDVEEHSDHIEIKCPVPNFLELKSSLESAISEPPSYCEITRIAKNSVEINSSKYESLEKMIGVLEDNDDVQNVYHNGEYGE